MHTRDVWRAVAVCCGLVAAGCEGGSKAPDVAELLGLMDEAMEQRCVALRGCYAALNEGSDRVCWGPTGSQGRFGWGLTSDANRSMDRQCLDKLTMRFPEQTKEHLRCFVAAYEAVNTCIDDLACAADISPCVALSKQSEAECAQKSGDAFQTALSEECGREQ